jgi:hypothetical protein
MTDGSPSAYAMTRPPSKPARSQLPLRLPSRRAALNFQRNNPRKRPPPSERPGFSCSTNARPDGNPAQKGKTDMPKKHSGRQAANELAEQVSRITSADRLFFERHPNRKHRVRIAGKAEIAETEMFCGVHMDVRPDESIFAVVRNEAPGKRSRLLIPGPKDAETDLSEDMARELFEAAISQGRLHFVVRGAA